MMNDDPDTAIRQTDTSAAHARLSATRRGYLIDPFASDFLPRPHLLENHPPLINIGTYLRIQAIDSLVHQFLETHPLTKKQIVSLGAGTDTRYWRLAAGPLRDQISAYVELDFPDITAVKASAIRKRKHLSSILGGNIKPVNGGAGLASSVYHLIPTDLRNGPEAVLEPLMTSILSPSIPTLVIAECVFVYMTPDQSGALLQAFSDAFEVLGAIVYEMFGLNDSFGRVMRDNLRVRHVELVGVDAFPTLETQNDRFLSRGYSRSEAWTLRQIRKDYTSSKELERIAKLEFLDEVEELDLVLAHYAIICASKSPDAQGLQNWGLQQRVQVQTEDESLQ